MPPDGSAAKATAGLTAFELLEQETDELTQEPTGVGLDVPAWILAWSKKSTTSAVRQIYLDRPEQWPPPLAQAPLEMEEVQRQLTGWELHPH